MRYLVFVETKDYVEIDANSPDEARELAAEIAATTPHVWDAYVTKVEGEQWA